MNAEIHVLTGARAGLVAKLVWEDVLLGRHPECGLQFHPTLDLEVSARHAAVVRGGERWFIRDLDSRNGTYLNGRRVTGDTLLWEGDQIMLGMTGPVLEFHLVGLVLAATQVTRAATAPSPVGEVPAEWRSARPFDAVRQNRRLRWLSATLALMLVAAVAISRFSGREQRAAWERERTGMQLRIDSLLLASEASARSVEGMLEGLTAALRQSQHEIRHISEQLRRAESSGDRSQVSSLRRRLETATVALDRQQLVAGLDFRGIERRNRRAVAKVYVEYDNGEVVTATAFAVRPDATLLTSRHVVAGVDGRRTMRRMAIQFSDSDQIWPSRLLSVAADADLALVKVDNIVGGVPTVQSLNLRSDTITMGAPVALIGFPLGGESVEMIATAANIARPLLSAGVLSGRRADRFELQGYGATGASGSPIFDHNGEVIAVLFGGRRDANGEQTLFSVPSSIVARLLEAIP